MAEKRLIQINNVPGGSTGGIMRGIHNAALAAGWQSEMLCPNAKENAGAAADGLTLFGSLPEISLQRVFNKQTGAYCQGFPFTTSTLLHLLDEKQPTVVQLHNLHHQYFDLPRLFVYLREKNIKTVWTLHDCWAFTGHCAHFQMAGCEKWKIGCGACPSLADYPATKKDRSRELFSMKQQAITAMDAENLTIVTPSHWLAELAQESFLGKFPVKTIYNGIDPAVFHPVESTLRAQYGIASNDFVVLGVAAPWSVKKGMDVFAQLAALAGESMKLVMVGVDDALKEQLPPEILALSRCDKKTLAEWYSTADVFLNPTREEVLGLVNLEALACGTPVVTFPTGGSPECIDDKSGICLSEPTAQAAWETLRQLRGGEQRFFQKDCRDRGCSFDAAQKSLEYVRLYEGASL